MYKARKTTFSNNWAVEKEYVCINGLRAWFTIAYIEEASEAEIGYTDGAFPSAQERAELIANILNKELGI